MQGTPGIELVYPALAGRFLTTGPPGKSPPKFLTHVCVITNLPITLILTTKKKKNLLMLQRPCIWIAGPMTHFWENLDAYFKRTERRIWKKISRGGIESCGQETWEHSGLNYPGLLAVDSILLDKELWVITDIPWNVTQTQVEWGFLNTSKATPKMLMDNNLYDQIISYVSPGAPV